MKLRGKILSLALAGAVIAPGAAVAGAFETASPAAACGSGIGSICLDGLLGVFTGGNLLPGGLRASFLGVDVNHGIIATGNVNLLLNDDGTGHMTTSYPGGNEGGDTFSDGTYTRSSNLIQFNGDNNTTASFLYSGSTILTGVIAQGFLAPQTT